MYRYVLYMYDACCGSSREHQSVSTRETRPNKDASDD